MAEAGAEMEVTAEDVDRTLTRAMLEISAAHSTLWGAVTDALVKKGVCDPSELQTLITARIKTVTPERGGGFYRVITDRAMRALPRAIEGSELLTEGEHV